MEIDRAAVSHNIRTIRAELGEQVEFCAVVKADAYGHGIDIVVPLLTAQGITAIGFASNDDAEAIRASGFLDRLLRVRPATGEEIADALRFGVEEWVGGAEHAALLRALAVAQQNRVRAHVSLNSTGLSRDGFEVGDPLGLHAAQELLDDPAIEVVGICSHFPAEDEVDVRAGSRRFDTESRRVIGATGRPIARHCATTFAALHVPESRFDLVRIGAGLYGDSTALGGMLRPAMRVMSRVAAVNSYRRGSTVGYDRWHRLEHDARLALIPVGYADGFHRSLSGTGDVLIRGQRARIVDRIAMNGFLVDVSHIDGAGPGDDVVLFGAQQGEVISAGDVERATGNIAADLYVAWGRLLPRRVADTPG